MKYFFLIMSGAFLSAAVFYLFGGSGKGLYTMAYASASGVTLALFEILKLQERIQSLENKVRRGVSNNLTYNYSLDATAIEIDETR